MYTWSLTLREERKLRVFEYMALRSFSRRTLHHGVSK